MDMKTLKRFAYIGAFLSESEKERAKSTVSIISGHGRWLPPNHYLGRPMFENEHMHHLTLLFKPKANPEAAQQLLPWIGKEIQIEATDLVTCNLSGHDEVQAFLCELPSGLYCDNKYPHITVSSGTRKDGKPVPPVASNSLFESYTPFEYGIDWRGSRGQFHPKLPLVLTARIGLFSYEKEAGIVYNLE